MNSSNLSTPARPASPPPRPTIPLPVLRIIQELEALKFGHALGGEFCTKRTAQ